MSEKDHTKLTLRQLVGYLVMFGLLLVAVFVAGAIVDYMLRARTRRPQGDRTDHHATSTVLRSTPMPTGPGA